MAKHILNKAPAQIKRKIQDYFNECDPHIIDVDIVDYKIDPAGAERTIKTKTKQKPYTTAGVANSIGLSPKAFQELSDPETPCKKGKIKITQAVKEVLTWAMYQVIEYAEKNLYTAGKQQGSQFVLKNIAGWKDKTEMEVPELSHSLVELEKTIAKALTKKK